MRQNGKKSVLAAFVKCAVCAFLAAVLALTAVPAGKTGSLAGGGGELSQLSQGAKEVSEIPAWAVKARHEYRFDFEADQTKTYYREHGLRIVSNQGFQVEGGVLKCRAGKKYTMASQEFLGDDYGISEGKLSFKLLVTGGTLSVLLRDTLSSLNSSDATLCFTFNADGSMTAIDASTGTEMKNAITGLFAGGNADEITILDRRNTISVLVNGEEKLEVLYEGGDGYVNNGEKERGEGGVPEYSTDYRVANYCNRLTFKNASGTVVSEKSTVQSAGRFLICADGHGGYIDDLTFNYTEVDQSLPEAQEQRVIDYSNWVATDDLGRTTPIAEAAGAPKENRSVGIFYFLCWTGAGIHVQDNTRIFLEQGVDGLKSYLTKQGGEAWWAEPYFGYYRNTDTWVYRKHAYMLDAAGFDFIFLDVSNAVVFPEGHKALFDTWLQIRKEGGHTPQICFLTGDNPKTLNTDVAELRKTVYSEEGLQKYDELFYKWKGKPLILGNLDGASRETRKFLEDFEVRGCWAWCDKDGYWNWIEELNLDENGQKYMYKGRNVAGEFEQLAVSLGHHSSSSKGRSFVLGKQPTNGQQNFEFYLESTPWGTGFASQAEYALEQAPPCVFVTGWNEWIAGNTRGSNFIANTPVDNVCYVDEFNPEFSRDGEPMKIRDGVGFGDNYYYQLVDFVRRYKGMDSLKTATGQQAVDTAAGENGWAEVGPAYRDTIGDVEFRNSLCYDAAFRYVNGTGRNDFDEAKVTQNGDSLWFTVTTVHDIIAADDASWMNLYVDTDMNRKTGWEGYDYVINRSRSGGKATVEKFTGNGFYDTKEVGTAEYAIVDGNRFTLKVDKKTLGEKTGRGCNFDFKWADNSTSTGNVMEFMDLGDVAPNDRFNFRFVSDGEVYEREVVEPALNPGKKWTPLMTWLAAAGGTLLVAAAVVAAVIIAKKSKK